MTTATALATTLRRLGACSEAIEYAETAAAIGLDPLTAAWQSGRADWLLWLAARALPGDRRVVRAASACARAVLPLARDEDRAALTGALEAVDRWCAGEEGVDLDASLVASWAASRAAESASRAAESASWAAAESASWAAEAAESAAEYASWAAEAAESAAEYASWATEAAESAAESASWATESIDLLSAIDSVLPIADIVAGVRR